MKLKLASGELTTLDNQIDPTTGTVKLKATFANRNSELFPNQFVNARLLVDVKKNALIVPSAAIQRTPQGAFAYVLNPDKTVAIRPVKTGASQGGETAIVEGLAVGEQVVVDGAERLREGSKVEVKERDQAGGGQRAPGGLRGEGKPGGKGGKPDGEQGKQPRVRP
jgi:multidrug efflux system membrane fusion protein